MLLLRFLFRWYNLFFSPDKDLARRVREMTGFVPARLSVFKLAFSHKSSQAGREPGQTNNERLEYLGDAVLGTVVAEYLFKKYPNADEGFLTKMRSKIVKRKSLNYIGDQMGLNILLSEYNRTRLSSSMLGNAVEALVGAVYLEAGYRGTKRFVVQRILKPYVDVHELETVDDNFKSQLLEACQREGRSVGYQLVSKYKQDRRDRFQVAVVINGEQIATADDYNKKAAEQLASLKALQKLNLIEASTLPTGTHLAAPSPELAPERKSRKKSGKSRRSDDSTAADLGREGRRRRSDVASDTPVESAGTERQRSRRHESSPADAAPTRQRRDEPAEARTDQASSSAAESSRRRNASHAGETPAERPRLSFAEATALAAQGAVIVPSDRIESQASDAEPDASTSSTEARSTRSSKRERGKKRSPAQYLTRHAVKGSVAVAALLDHFDAAEGRFTAAATGETTVESTRTPNQREHQSTPAAERQPVPFQRDEDYSPRPDERRQELAQAGAPDGPNHASSQSDAEPFERDEVDARPESDEIVDTGGLRGRGRGVKRPATESSHLSPREQAARRRRRRALPRRMLGTIVADGVAALSSALALGRERGSAPAQSSDEGTRATNSPRKVRAKSASADAGAPAPSPSTRLDVSGSAESETAGSNPIDEAAAVGLKFESDEREGPVRRSRRRRERADTPTSAFGGGAPGEGTAEGGGDDPVPPLDLTRGWAVGPDSQEDPTPDTSEATGANGFSRKRSNRPAERPSEEAGGSSSATESDDTSDEDAAAAPAARSGRGRNRRRATETLGDGDAQAGPATEAGPATSWEDTLLELSFPDEPADAPVTEARNRG